jgi:peptidoglycan hydrolase CwlO-like protein
LGFDSNNKATSLPNQINSNSIYSLQEEIGKYMKEITNEVSFLEERVNSISKNSQQKDVKPGQGKGNSKENENIEYFTNEINLFYNSIQSLRYLQTKIQADIFEVENKIRVLDR